MEMHTREAPEILLIKCTDLVVEYEHVINIHPKQSLDTGITKCLLHFRQDTDGEPSHLICSKQVVTGGKHIIGF